MLPTTYYHRFMTSEWLQKNAQFDCNIDPTQTNETQLAITADVRKFERVLHVDLVNNAALPCQIQMTRSTNLTVKLRMGLVYTGKQPPDPLSFMISDGDWAIGYQFLDYNTYHQNGPYYPIEGKPRHVLEQAIVMEDAKIPIKGTVYWPRVFEITLNPADRIGSCYCAADCGHMIMAEYGQALDPTTRNGLSLEVYRGEAKEHYLINFIEVTILGNN